MITTNVMITIAGMITIADMITSTAMISTSASLYPFSSCTLENGSISLARELNRLSSINCN
jgi:hypothetical protein